jgi:hypothetical protein
MLVFFFRLAGIERVRRCISSQILGYIISGCCCISRTNYWVGQSPRNVQGS